MSLDDVFLLLAVVIAVLALWQPLGRQKPPHKDQPPDAGEQDPGAHKP